MVGLLLHPPKSDDKYAQLTRGAFIINDFLRNSHFKDSFDKINYLDNILSASFNSVCIFKEISLVTSDKIRRTEIYQIICSNIPGG